MKPRIVLLYTCDQNFDRVLTDALGGTGVVVLTARSVADALQIVCQPGSELDFAVIDFNDGIEPVFTKTNGGRNEESTLMTLDAYGDQRKRVEEVIQQRIAHGDEPSAVAEVIYCALITASPRRYYPVGEGIMLSQLRRFVPPRLFDRVFSKQFQLDEPSK